MRRALDENGDGNEQAGGDQHLPGGKSESACGESVRANGDDRDCPARGGTQEHRVRESLIGCLRLKGRSRNGEHASRPSPMPSRDRRGARSRNHQAASGTTQNGVEKASTEALPAGRMVKAKAVKAEYAAI